MKEQKS